MIRKNRKNAKTHTGAVAKERLKLMIDAQRQRLDDETLDRIRQEIGAIITKYVDIEPENVEIKIILKDYKSQEICEIKRETHVETV